jgi:DNA gyrase subunit B
MDPKTIRTRLQELAFLNSQATIWFRAVQGSTSQSNGASHAEDEQWEELHFSGGLTEYVAFLNRESQPMHEPIYISDKASTLCRTDS